MPSGSQRTSTYAEKVSKDWTSVQGKTKWTIEYNVKMLLRQSHFLLVEMVRKHTSRRRRKCTSGLRLFILFISILFNVKLIASQDINVLLRNGQVQGKLVETENRQVYAYLGIPYAKPPINQRRFKPPEPHDGWNDPLRAYEFGPACPQPFRPGLALSEDCLTLNIWAPANVRLRQMPVVVLIEGELFITSDPSKFPGQDLAVFDLIVVTLNYRVNAFGFLSWQDRNLPGNLGLLDQALALRWVVENIENFGGDATSITLLGHSAGAASVAFHLASEHSRALFKKAIMMSGSSLAPWAVNRQPKLATSVIAKELGCPLDSSTRNMSLYLARCLQRSDITLTEIVSKVEKMVEAGNPFYLFAPVWDGHVTKSKRLVGEEGPLRMLENVPPNYPVVIGVAQHDGSILLHIKREINYMSHSYLRRYAREVLIPMVNVMSNFNGPGLSLLNHLVDFSYLQSNADGNKDDLIRSTIQMFTDSFYAAPSVLMTDVLSRKGLEVHFYVNNYISSDIYESPSNLTGSLHGSELAYLFGPTAYTSIFRRPMSYDVAKMSETLKKMVYSFAFRGEPTMGPSYPLPPRWEKYTMRDPVYAVLNSGQLSLNYRYHDLAFWNYLLPDLAKMSQVDGKPPVRPGTTTSRPGGTRNTTSSFSTIILPPSEVSAVSQSAVVWILVALVLLLILSIATYMIFARRRQRLKSASLSVP